MFRKLRKFFLHPNLYFYDYFRKKLGFKKYFVTDKIRLLDAGNHQKWLKVLFSNPHLYLYYKFNKRLRKPAYPILVSYHIESLQKNNQEGGGKLEVLTVELENKNIIYFADPEVLQKIHDDKEPYLAGKIFKFVFRGSGNSVFIDSGVKFGRSFRVNFDGKNNSISFDKGCRLQGGLIDLNGNENEISFGPSTTVCDNAKIYCKGYGNTLLTVGNCEIMSGAQIRFSQNSNYAYIGPKSTLYPTARINFAGSNALAYFCGSQNIRQSITLTMGNIFFHGGRTNNNTTTNHHYLAFEGKNIVIGADTMFATSLLIRTSDTHLIYDNQTLNRINTGKSIIIGDHVWIGQESIVFKGARIKDGCMIGARSIVTKQIPANCLCAGVPAVVKREHIVWDRDLTINLTKEELDDYERYIPPKTEYQPIGYEKLLRIDAINFELSPEEKIELIQDIIN